MKNHVTEAMTMTSARANRLAESKGAGRYAGGVPVRFRNALDNPLYASDVGLIVALVLALLFVTDPLGLPFERITATKHFGQRQRPRCIRGATASGPERAWRG
jgi:hypothetical protein